LGGFIAGPSYNEPQGQYVLSQILSQNARTGQTVNVYLNSIFKSPYNIDFDAPADQLEGLSAIVAAHELGHALGLVHTAEFREGAFVNEVQTVQISGGGPSDRFALSFAGETTELLDRNATAIEVQNALRALHAISNHSDLVVDGLPGGPYTVLFVNP